MLAVMLVGVAYLLILNTRNLTEEIGGERVVEEVNIIQSRLAEIEKELQVDTNFVVTSVNFFQAVGGARQPTQLRLSLPPMRHWDWTTSLSLTVTENG